MNIQSLSSHLSGVLSSAKHFWSCTASRDSPKQLKELGTCFESKKNNQKSTNKIDILSNIIQVSRSLLDKLKS